MSAWGKYLVQQSRTNLTKKGKNTTSKLYKSISYDLNVSENQVDLFIDMLDYGKFQDKGVRGANAYYADPATASSPFRFKSSSKIPPVQDLATWAKKRNIRLRDEKGRYTKGNYNTIGYLIARSIRDKGIRASLFFTRAYDLSNKKFGSQVGMEIAKDFADHIKQNYGKN